MRESSHVTLQRVDLIKDLHMAMNNNRPEAYTLPDTQGLIAQYLLLYEMSGGEALDEWVDYGYRTLRVSVQVKESSSTMTERFEEIQRLGGEHLPAGTTIQIVGEIPLMMKMVNLLSRGQILSVLVAFGVITVMMIFVLGSVRVGLLSMIPNAFPVLTIGALMGAASIPLDLITVMVMPMIIGIAVDDTVHYILHFKQGLRASGGYLEANRRAFRKTGPAILYTSIILSLGYLIFGLSDMRSLLFMAILSSTGILSALIGDLLITPALFLTLKPFGKEPPPPA